MVRERIVTLDVDVSNLQAVVDRILMLVGAKKSSYVCVSNVHMCMEAYDSDSFCSIVNQADLVIADGKPLSVAQNMMGHKGAEQVRGQDIMSSLCALSSQLPLRLGFYGGNTNAVLSLMKANLSTRYPNIQIDYSFSPPFRALRKDEDTKVIKSINESNIDVLFVGIGCPKQEIWMAEHKDSLNCVMLGVGAAFDFIAGNKKHAPRWVQKIGLEWLFRLLSEPRRLSKRYLKHNPRFVWLFLQQWLLKRNFKKS
jgi:N-acetylglucosaminyldiphosphoundecaprenol N-acetyl-beta-D-mannosaminyltransferase